MTESPSSKRATSTRASRRGPVTLEVLRGVNSRSAPAERLAIVGASGSGKTTLLQILGGLDRPTAGRCASTGATFTSSSERERGELRNHALGFVYQFHHLLPEFSALENVAMPLLVRRTSVAEAKARAQRDPGAGRAGRAARAPAAPAFGR